MTCVVVALAGGRAHIFADSANLGPTGALAFLGPKITAYADQRFAFAARGAAFHSLAIRQVARRCQSYADARDRLSRALCGPLGRFICLWGPWETFVAGIDASGAPAAFMIVAHRKHEGVEPFSPLDLDYAVSTGPLPDIDAGAAPIAFGIRAAELQRGVLQRLPFARRPVSIVGGSLQHVVIGSDGIKSETLGGWSDRLGDKLNPAAQFSRSGEKGRPAPALGVTAWLFPRTLKTALKTFAILYLSYVAVRLALMAPAMIYVERTYHRAPQMTLETGAGGWDVYTRLDLGKLTTSPTIGRETAAAAIHRKSLPADHVEAARLSLMDAGRDCRIVASRELLLDEYEHEVACR